MVLVKLKNHQHFQFWQEFKMILRNTVLECMALNIFGYGSDDDNDDNDNDNDNDDGVEIATSELTESEILKDTITAVSGGLGMSAFTLCNSDDFDNIPQDPSVFGHGASLNTIRDVVAYKIQLNHKRSYR
jgi:hypothetical protein